MIDYDETVRELREKAKEASKSVLMFHTLVYGELLEDAANAIEELRRYNTALEGLICEDGTQTPKIGDLIVNPVLCRKCKWYLRTGYGKNRKCYRPNKGGNGGLKMNPDDFCSYGED